MDEVIVFDEDTPYELIKRVRPHILVKGEDYRNQLVVGRDLVREVRYAPLLDGRSTTRIASQLALQE